jgi:hypothetical protein
MKDRRRASGKRPRVRQLLFAAVLLFAGSAAIFGQESDDQLWKRLDSNEDGWLSGNELAGGWKKYDRSGDNEVTKAEFVAGRAKDRAATGTTGAAISIPSVTTGKSAADSPSPRTIGNADAANASGPRSGKYNVLSYGSPSNPPIRLGYFDLIAGGSYRFFDNGGNLVGEGKYAFDAASKRVTWISGPFKDNGWDGGFEVSREGKTHIIRLKRSTIGTNSTDS